MKDLTLKLICLLFALLLTVSVCACGGSDEQTDATAGATAGATTNATADATAADTSADVTEAPTEPETLSPEAQEKADDLAFLATVTDHNYELTDKNEPFFVGRWFEKEIDGVTHTVSLTDGCQFYFLIQGTDTVTLDFTVITTMEEPYFAYIIDGGEPVRQHITDGTVTLPDTGRHLVQIVTDGLTETEGKWVEEKGFALKSVTPGEGGRIKGVRPTDKVIFFFGDSITEGIRALNMNATADGNSATNAYPWQCSKVLGTVTYPIGYGATGIIMTGSFNTMKLAMDYNSKDRPVEDSFYPSVICINHATNDGGQPDAAFTTALEDTLTHLREKWPDVPVVYIIPFNQTKAACIRKVMEGFENGYVVETREWRLRGKDFTDGVHPSVQGAQTAGQKLAEALIGIFGEEFFK